MITVRLDPETRAALERLAESRGLSHSEVVRDAILRMIEEAEGAPTAYDRLAPFVGVTDSGGRELSRETGTRFREILEAKRNERAPR